MQELSEAIDGEAARLLVDGDPHIFILAAQKWAAASLMSFKGSLLDKALSVSVALADFVAELEEEKD